jgi:hypothetical protein
MHPINAYLIFIEDLLRAQWITSKKEYETNESARNKHDRIDDHHEWQVRKKNVF